MRYLSEEYTSSCDTWKTMYNDVIRVIRNTAKRNIAFSSVISSGLNGNVVSSLYQIRKSSFIVKFPSEKVSNL